MSMFLLWITLHKVAFTLMVGFVLWVSAFAFYFKTDLKHSALRTRRHGWRVDLVSKQAYRGNKLEPRKGEINPS